MSSNDRTLEQIAATLDSVVRRLAELERGAPRVAPDALSEPTQRLLAAVQAAPGSHASTVDLCAALQATRQAVHRYIAEAEAKGLVVTVRGKRRPDGRRGPDEVYWHEAIAI